jgi:hypothetical protein
MLSKLTDSRLIAEAVSRRQVVADGSADLREEWLGERGLVALPEESGRHLEEDECRRLAVAFRSFGVDRLIAIANDPLLVDEMVYELAASAEDLAAFSSEFSGINALLLPATGVDMAVLFTMDDYHLVAGSRQFVSSYAGDIHAAQEEFLRFVDDHLEVMQPTLRRVSRYLLGVDGSG